MLTSIIHLQNPLSCILCFHFGRRGREGWRELQKDHFSVKSDAENHRYVTIQLTESTKNNPGGHTLTSKIFGRFIFRTKVASENIIVRTLKRPNNLTVRKFNCPEMSEILILPKF